MMQIWSKKSRQNDLEPNLESRQNDLEQRTTDLVRSGHTYTGVNRTPANKTRKVHHSDHCEPRTHKSMQMNTHMHTINNLEPLLSNNQTRLNCLLVNAGQRLNAATRPGMLK